MELQKTGIFYYLHFYNVNCILLCEFLHFHKRPQPVNRPDYNDAMEKRKECGGLHSNCAADASRRAIKSLVEQPWVVSPAASSTRSETTATNVSFVRRFSSSLRGR